MILMALLRTFMQNFSGWEHFLKFLLRSDNELLVSETQKKLGVTDFISKIKHSEKLVHVI